MKYPAIIMLGLLAPMALAAKPRCQSFSNLDDKVTIVFTDDGVSEDYSVADVRLVTGGKEHPATSVQTDVRDGTATVILTFPHLTRFSNPKVKLTINRKPTKFPVCQ